jgi:hypothetical protein
MLLTVLGSAMGGLMTRPTADQLAAARATRVMAAAGAHTVGGPDGGPGLPGTGWSREHGDLRVPHFLGLHAVQIIPLLALLVRRRVTAAARRRRAVLAIGVSYATLLVILLVQALGGESVIAPGWVTRGALAAWLMATGGALWLALAARGNGSNAHAMPGVPSRL